MTNGKSKLTKERSGVKVVIVSTQFSRGSEKEREDFKEDIGSRIVSLQR